MSCKFKRREDKLIAEFSIAEFDEDDIEALIEELEKNYRLAKKIVKAKKELKRR